MLIFILAIVVLLVAWSLHLMQQAVDRGEFSLMLAGTLVAFSAAAMVVVYFLMGNYIGYVAGLTPITSSRLSAEDVAAWVVEIEEASYPAHVSAIDSSVWQAQQPEPFNTRQ
jgi:uncharacterized membrane protein